MQVVFMGTPEFAVPSLRALTTEHELMAVYTRPDAVRGRGTRLVPSPVKAEALALGIPVSQPPTLRDPAAIAHLHDVAADIIVVAAYGLILPAEALAATPLGAVNVHASLLPRWRGAAPVERAILAGDEVTGVSIMRVEEGLDTGPWAVAVEVPVDDLDASALSADLAEAGADALLDTIRAVEAGTVVWHEQDDRLATYAAKVGPADVAIDPSVSVEDSLRRVRASGESAPSTIVVAGARLRVSAAARSDLRPAPGAVLVTKHDVVIGSADGGVALLSVVPEGRRAMAVSDWARGALLPEGTTWSGA